MSSPELEKAKIEAEKMMRIARMPHYHYEAGWRDGVKCMYHMVNALLWELTSHKKKLTPDLLYQVRDELRRHYMDCVTEIYQGDCFSALYSNPFIRINWAKSDEKKKKYVVEWFVPRTEDRIMEAQQILLQELMKPKSDILINRPQNKKQ